VRLIAIISPILFAVVVVVLGMLTPGYDHFAYTISRLAIGPHGVWQQLNFLQLGAGFVAFGFSMIRATNSASTRRVWLTFAAVSALLSIAVVIFPTDPIENKKTIFDTISLTGRIHMIALTIFLILAPLGVFDLARALQRDTSQNHLYRPTVIIGIIVIFLMALWGVIFPVDWFIPYRGLIQKIIAVLCICHLEYCLLTTTPRS